MLRANTTSRKDTRAEFLSFGRGTPSRWDILDTHSISPMIRRGQRILVPSKRVLFNKGDAATGLYLLLSGHVKVSTISQHGHEMILAILGPGNMIGEVALLDQMERTATVTTLTPSELMSISRYDVMSAIEQNPGSAFQILCALTKRLRIATSLIEDLVFLDLPSRLAKKLLALAESFGHRTQDGLRIDCRVTQQELANMVGTTRESINKVLSAWKAKGLLSMAGGCLLLSRPEELVATATSPRFSPL